MSEESLPINNDLKIRFCNAFVFFSIHCKNCGKCDCYIQYAEDDLCPKGKAIIGEHLFYADTRPVLTK